MNGEVNRVSGGGWHGTAQHGLKGTYFGDGLPGSSHLLAGWPQASYFYLSGPQFPHLENGDHPRAYLPGLSKEAACLERLNSAWHISGVRRKWAVPAAWGSEGCLLCLWPHMCKFCLQMASSKPCKPYYPHFIRGKLRLREVEVTCPMCPDGKWQTREVTCLTPRRGRCPQRESDDYRRQASSSPRPRRLVSWALPCSRSPSGPWQRACQGAWAEGLTVDRVGRLGPYGGQGSC